MAEVGCRLHFHQPTDCAIPCENLICHGGLSLFFRDVKQRDGVQGRCANHFGVGFVECIDQRDEATNLIALLHRQSRNVCHKDSMECMADSQVVRCSQGLVAKIHKGEESNVTVLCASWNNYSSTLRFNLNALADKAMGDPLKLRLQGLLLVFTIRSEVDPIIVIISGRTHSIVHFGTDVMHIGESFQHWNKWQKQWPIQSIQVQVLWGTI
mmetsp:Transcript_63264/g.138539  ORF Transcript_63264/g.138539 Transcript_63264/m.138539 type:complete len:211 (+) Transcript_63264:553-1185(+)